MQSYSETNIKEDAIRSWNHHSQMPENTQDIIQHNHFYLLSVASYFIYEISVQTYVRPHDGNKRHASLHGW